MFALYTGHILFPPLVALAVEPLGWEWAFTLATLPPLLIASLAILGIENIKSGTDLDQIAR